MKKCVLLGLVAVALVPAASVGAGDAPSARMNMDIEGSASTVCAGVPVDFTLTTRLLGGAPGLSLRDIEVEVSTFPTEVWVPGDAHFDATSDVGSDGFISYSDVNMDSKNDEEFVWRFTATFTATTTVMASDSALVYFNDSPASTERIGASDSWTVTVSDGPECSGSSGATTTTVGRGLPSTGSSAGSWMVASVVTMVGALLAGFARRRGATQS